jgi:hypothetical protein
VSDQKIRGDAPSTDASEGAVTVTIDGCRVGVCDSEGLPITGLLHDDPETAAELLREMIEQDLEAEA